MSLSVSKTVEVLFLGIVILDWVVLGVPTKKLIEGLGLLMDWLRLEAVKGFSSLGWLILGVGDNITRTAAESGRFVNSVGD